MTSAEHARAIFRARHGIRRGTTPQVLPIACPWCSAAPHRPCRDRALVVLARVHDARSVAWVITQPPPSRTEPDPVSTPIPMCPECRTGKCRTCPGWALDAQLDQEVPCGCGRHDDDNGWAYDSEPELRGGDDRDDEGREEIARSTR